MTIHLPTLLFVAGLAITFVGALLIMARGTGGDHRALGLWGAAMVIGATGLVASALADRMQVVPPWAGTVLYLVGSGMSWTAARIFADRGYCLRMAVAGPALYLLCSTTLSNAAFSAACGCLLAAAYTAATAAELWRTRHEYLSSRAPAIGFLILHALIYAAQGLALASGRVPELRSDIVTALALEGLLHTLGMALLLLAMVKERADLRATAQLRHLVGVDGLTGISNRRRFDEHLSAEILRARRTRSPVAVILIDVDLFKQLNDVLGHQHGDACLREVALAAAGLVRRPGDIAARYGGEEFALVLSDTSLEGAVIVANRIRLAIHGLSLQHPGPTGVLSISAGAAAMVPDDPADGTRLLADADSALYRAKASGRNAVCQTPHQMGAVSSVVPVPSTPLPT